ncbi:MAG: hypothetical protein RLZZ184_2143 [Cyanobacteriota bacterium]|jgi:predicted nuclease of predicted toxin-antitoxin system
MKLLFDHNLSPNLINYLADIYPNSNHLYLMQKDSDNIKKHQIPDLI